MRSSPVWWSSRLRTGPGQICRRRGRQWPAIATRLSPLCHWLARYSEQAVELTELHTKIFTSAEHDRSIDNIIILWFLSAWGPMPLRLLLGVLLLRPLEIMIARLITLCRLCLITSHLKSATYLGSNHWESLFTWTLICISHTPTQQALLEAYYCAHNNLLVYPSGLREEAINLSDWDVLIQVHCLNRSPTIYQVTTAVKEPTTTTQRKRLLGIVQISLCPSYGQPPAITLGLVAFNFHNDHD